MQLINALTVNHNDDTTLTEDQRWGLFIVVLNNCTEIRPHLKSQLRHSAIQYRHQYDWTQEGQATWLIDVYNHFFIGKEDRLSAHPI